MDWTEFEDEQINNSVTVIRQMDAAHIERPIVQIQMFIKNNQENQIMSSAVVHSQLPKGDSLLLYFLAMIQI